MTSTPETVGYLDRLSYTPGQPISVFASNGGEPVDIRLVRLGRGPVPGRDVPAATEEIEWAGAGRYTVTPQTSSVGSFFDAALSRHVSSEVGFTAGAWVQPTLLGADREQTLFEIASPSSTLVVTVTAGEITARVLSGGVAVAEARVADAVRDRAWSFVTVKVEASSLELSVSAGDELYSNSGSASVPLGMPVNFDGAPRITFAARGARDIVFRAGYAHGVAGNLFEGKIAYPFVLLGTSSMSSSESGTRGNLIARISASGGALWDLAPQRSGSNRYRAPLIAGAGEPGTLVNLPNQGVTGPDWDATEVSFRVAPEQYSAAHFHSTDIVDAGWNPIVVSQLPIHLPSAVYGIELASADGSTDTIPLFVTPDAGTARKRIAFLASTFTYLAYGNEDLLTFFANVDVHALHNPEVEAVFRERQVTLKREWGLSAYDTHPDGSGIHYSSSLRPLLDFRPDYRFWAFDEGARGFTADLYLVEWLEKNGYEFDVLTDLELHLQGDTALDGYDVVLTGSHPEYHSKQILNALESFRDSGGKIGYLGGNGFYWVTGLINTEAQVIEIRRGHVGIRTWESEPGEVDLVSSWEPGGLWRFRGRAPQKLVGVGMTGQGGESRPYWIPTQPGTREAEPWFYDGLDGATIGEKGFVGGAAAGDEVDRVDTKLGTPPGTIVLASSRDHPTDAQRAAEEILQLFHGSTSGPNDPDIRADMVYYEAPGGGAVFSTGAIAFIASLLVDDGDNSSSRALRNVMEKFLE